MTDGEALFRAILDDPDDDLSRLAYADWLEENDRLPRAQLIRLMCEVARLAPSRAAVDRHRLKEATSEYCSLLSRHESEWLAELPSIADVKWGIFREPERFRRGFAHAITVPRYDTLQTHAKTLMESSPVEWLRLEESDGRIAQWPYLERLSRLDLSRNLLVPSNTAHKLAASPHFRRLKWLQVGWGNMDAHQVIALMSAPWFANVERFEARGVIGTGSSLPPVPPCPRLRFLQISDNQGTLDFITVLSRQSFPNLRRLNLSGYRIGDTGAARLVSNDVVRELLHLDLSRTGLSARGALALATTPLLENLEFLDLRYNAIPPSHCRRLRDRFERDDCRLMLSEKEG
ncbi:MAG: TIGR02996 domain-containing protein [Planctomycetia bacterium]|nr:TIGR02996 domain-containing protein [Planctomycetia bacterium]